MTSCDRDPVDVVAEEFAERVRRGETPSVTEYIERHPEISSELRDVLPSVAMMEQLAHGQRETPPPPRSAMDDDSPAPEQIGDFRIVREVGRGGMGVVYEAIQESLGRHVALKVLPPNVLTSPKQVRRFQREAQAAARLHHTNIVPVFGVGESDGVNYYIMQYIQGQALDAWIIDQKSQSSLPATAPSQPHAESTPARTPSQTAPTPSSAATPSEPTPTIDSPDLLVGATERTAAEDELEATPLQPASTQPASPEEVSPLEATILTDSAAVLPRPRADQSTADEVSVSSDDFIPATPPPTAIEPALVPQSWRQIAEIGRQTASALAYAHEQGILHRDIKPANLILDHHDIVWITDFGLAKIAEQEDLTHSGDIVGTLRYMAPEQFTGSVDARTDIYALGLTLYELATLKPAFDELDRSRLIRQVTQDTPVRPRQVNRAIPRDLETIILKCIARTPEHRYQLAEELSLDLRAFLEDRPIAARRANVIERFWLWCRRDPITAGLSAGIATLLLLIAGMATVGYSRAITQRNKIQIQSDRAEANLDLALRAFDEMFEQLTTAPSGQLGDAFDEDRGEMPHVPAAVTNRDAVLLSNLLSFYELFADQNTNTPGLQQRIAKATLRVGEIYLRLEQYDEAREAFQRALELADETHYRNSGDETLQVMRASLHNSLGTIHERRNQPTEAIQEHQLAMEVLTLDGALDGSPLQKFELARTYTLAAISQFRQYDPRGATQNLNKARDILDQLVTDNPEGAQYQYLQAKVLSGLFQTQMQLRNESEALQHRTDAIAILESLVQRYPDVPEYNYELSMLLSLTPPVAFSDEVRDRILTSLRRSQELAAKLSESNPESAKYQALLGRIDQKLAYMLFASGLREDAEQPLRDAIAIHERLADQHPDAPEYSGILSHAYGRLAEYLLEQNQAEEAKQVLEKAIARLTPSAGGGPVSGFQRRLLAAHYDGLARTYEALGDKGQADSWRERSQQYGGSTPRSRFDNLRRFSRGRGGPGRGGPERGGPSRGGFEGGAPGPGLGGDRAPFGGRGRGSRGRADEGPNVAPDGRRDGRQFGPDARERTQTPDPADRSPQNQPPAPQEPPPKPPESPNR